MVAEGEAVAEKLAALGFVRFARLAGRALHIESPLPPAPAVYVAVLDGAVFWVGETGDIRRRFHSYRRWLALPDDSPRADAATRDRLLEIADGRALTFFRKEPMTIRSDLTGRDYPAHRVEETILIDYFRPAWNTRAGGRSRG